MTTNNILEFEIKDNTKPISLINLPEVSMFTIPSSINIPKIGKNIDSINIDEYDIINLKSMPLRYNLMRLLTILKLINSGINFKDIKFNYSNYDLDDDDLIIKKIYDMSGLTFGNHLIWGLYFPIQFDTDHSKYSKENEIDYLNSVIDIWLFLIDSNEISKYLYEIIILATKFLKGKLNDKKKHLTKPILMYLKINNIFRFSPHLLEILIFKLKEIPNNNWLTNTEISFEVAATMHIQLIEVFQSIIKPIRETWPIKLPKDINTNIQCYHKLNIDKSVYVSQILALINKTNNSYEFLNDFTKEYGYIRKYDDFKLYSNGLIIKKQDLYLFNKNQSNLKLCKNEKNIFYICNNKKRKNT